MSLRTVCVVTFISPCSEWAVFAALPASRARNAVSLSRSSRTGLRSTTSPRLLVCCVCLCDSNSSSDFHAPSPKVGGKKYTPKVFSALKIQVPQQAKKRFGVYQKACFQGKKRENTCTPKSLQGGCWGPLRAVLV